MHLPLVGWLIVAALVLLLLGLCGATAYGSVRMATRERVARWSGLRMLAAVAVAAVPWLLVWLAARLMSGHANVSIHGLGPLIGWFLVALVVFALLVLLPLAALLVGIVWIGERRRRPASGSDVGSEG